jgi:hypothetical protein
VVPYNYMAPQDSRSGACEKYFSHIWGGKWGQLQEDRQTAPILRLRARAPQWIDIPVDLPLSYDPSRRRTDCAGVLR